VYLNKLKLITVIGIATVLTLLGVPSLKSLVPWKPI